MTLVWGHLDPKLLFYSCQYDTWHLSISVLICSLVLCFFGCISRPSSTRLTVIPLIPAIVIVICNGFWDIAILLLNVPLALIIFIISFVISLVPSNIYCLTTEAIHVGTKWNSCFLVNIIPFSVFLPHEQN